MNGLPLIICRKQSVALSKMSVVNSIGKIESKRYYQIEISLHLVHRSKMNGPDFATSLKILQIQFIKPTFVFISSDFTCVFNKINIY
jgi:hypothetical protein